jgi:hypothetical protein
MKGSQEEEEQALSEENYLLWPYCTSIKAQYTVKYHETNKRT